MKVLVIAQDAQIRNALVTQFGIRNRQFHCVDGDWLKAQSDSLVMPADIGIVVNAINLEELQGPSGDTSFEQVKFLASACGRAGRVLIQLSSNQVFDGIKGVRHKESDAVDPASRIGASLLRVEQIIPKACSRYIILRSGVLFSATGNNIITSLIKRFKRKKPMALSNSGSCCLIHTSDLARVISAIIDQLSCGGQAWGTYHYHSSDPASRFKFAETVLAAVSQYDQALSECIDLKAVDKADTRWSQPLLNCEKILNTFGIKQLPWRMFVVQTVKNIVAPPVDK